MKNLTLDFLKTIGFEFIEITYENGVEYHYMYPGLFIELTVVTKYSEDGKLQFTTFLDNWELENTGGAELLTLIKVLPKAGVKEDETKKD